jgi:hypothetical protein
MRVTRKLVYRWSIGGKTFHNETAAYRYLAKKELGRMIANRVQNIVMLEGGDWETGATEEQVRRVYIQMFPPKNNHYPFDQTAYRAWINAKLNELREADKKEQTT